MLLTIAGNLLYRIGRGDGGRGLIVAAGVALGLLMLTRAAFFYSSVALLPLALVVDWGEYPLAFVAYTPEAGSAVLDRTVDDGRWPRWDSAGALISER